MTRPDMAPKKIIARVRCRSRVVSAVLGSDFADLEENMAIHEMSFTRLLDAPADKLFRCWTTPELIKQWFAPRPWTVPAAEVDLKPGGASSITMRSPEGQDMPCPGQ